MFVYSYVTYISNEMFNLVEMNESESKVAVLYRLGLRAQEFGIRCEIMREKGAREN